jgi:hypothetical protein
VVKKLFVFAVLVLLLAGCGTPDKVDLIRYQMPVSGELALPNVEEITKDLSLYTQLATEVPNTYELHSADWIIESVKLREKGTWKLAESEDLVTDAIAINVSLSDDFIYTQVGTDWCYVAHDDETYKVILTRTQSNAVFVYTL